jgi:hypothetical protein
MAAPTLKMIRAAGKMIEMDKLNVHDRSAPGMRMAWDA